MDKYYLLEVLNCVFATNRDAFISFIQCELIFSFSFPKRKQKEIHNDIIEQLEYVLNKEEDACKASSKIVDLLNNLKKSFKD